MTWRLAAESAQLSSKSNGAILEEKALGKSVWFNNKTLKNPETPFCSTLPSGECALKVTIDAKNKKCLQSAAFVCEVFAQAAPFAGAKKMTKVGDATHKAEGFFWQASR